MSNGRVTRKPLDSHKRVSGIPGAVQWRLSPEHSDLYKNIKWQDVLQALDDGVKDDQQDDDAKVLVRWLKTYMESQVEVLKPLAKHDELQGQFERGGTGLQRKAVDGIWYLFREIGVYGRANRGYRWSGYAFMKGLTPVAEHAWFGFIDKGLVADRVPGGACFVVATTFDCPKTDTMNKIELVNPWWNGKFFVWQVDLERVRDDEAAWHEITKVFADVYAKRKAAVGPESAPGDAT